MIKNHLHSGEFWPLHFEQFKYWFVKLYRVFGWELEEPWEAVERVETP
jgi:hypothetical protein